MITDCFASGCIAPSSAIYAEGNSVISRSTVTGSQGGIATYRRSTITAARSATMAMASSSMVWQPSHGIIRVPPMAIRRETPLEST